MSNADKEAHWNVLCAACGKRRAGHLADGGCGSFIEPAPQPAPKRADFRCSTCGGPCDGPCDEGDAEYAASQLAPSGDEAKVREIAEMHCKGVIDLHNVEGFVGVSPHAAIDAATREAYAAGKVDERKECVRLIRARADVAYILTDFVASQLRKALHSVADAIARRGSEGT